MERKFNFSSGEFYHLYGRGVNKGKIFHDYKDYYRFVALLYLTNSSSTFHLSDYRDKNFEELFNLTRRDTLVDVGAYCLMPNHFHLLVYEKEEKGISKFMLKLITAFAMYYNKKYTRTGSLFERPYRAQHISNDEHLKYLFAYIHLNPVRVQDPEGWEYKRIANPESAGSFLENYIFSSYNDYIGEERVAGKIINRKPFPEYFDNNHTFQSFFKDWLDFDQI